jgi:hypothetical protein
MEEMKTIVRELANELSVGILLTRKFDEMIREAAEILANEIEDPPKVAAQKEKLMDFIVTLVQRSGVEDSEFIIGGFHHAMEKFFQNEVFEENKNIEILNSVREWRKMKCVNIELEMKVEEMTRLKKSLEEEMVDLRKMYKEAIKSHVANRKAVVGEQQRLRIHSDLKRLSDYLAEELEHFSFQ